MGLEGAINSEGYIQRPNKKQLFYDVGRFSWDITKDMVLPMGIGYLIAGLPGLGIAGVISAIYNGIKEEGPKENEDRFWQTD